VPEPDRGEGVALQGTTGRQPTHGRAPGLPPDLERILHNQRDHEMATVLQDELLDVELRSTAAVACTRYVASTDMLRVGGDWYTATGLADGSVAVSVGDVVGTGVRAAAVMSQLRSALSAAALGDHNPGAVLDIVNRHAGLIQSADGTTAAYAVIDPERRLVSYACAGHPYPILVEPNGDVRYLEDGRGGPLGIDDASTYGVGTCPFEPGSLLLLYTDGLIERRDEPLDCGLERLRAHAEEYARLPSSLASDSMIEALTPPNGYSDDIAIVAVRLVGTTSRSFVDAVEARPAQYIEGRHRLRAWLQSLGIDPRTQHDVLVAVGEAVMNAIEHGGRELGVHHVVTTEAFADEGQVVVTVNDCGQWNLDTTRSRRLDTRGRGLTLMYGLMDHVEIRRSRNGTQVVLTHRLDREDLE